MAATRFDEDGSAGIERVDLTVELDVAFAFEDVIKLGHDLVVMELAILFDLDEVHRGDCILIVHEGAARLSAGTGRGGDVGEPGNLKIRFNDLVLHAIVYARAHSFERGALILLPPGDLGVLGGKPLNMNKSAIFFLPGITAALCLAACGEKAPDPVVTPPAEQQATGPAVSEPVTARPRELTTEEQKEVIDGVMQARAKQQAEGLGKGAVKVNGAWNYTGYSHLAPDPAAAIEARLIAVDVTVSGHTPFFDIDDIEVIDGITMISYGSDPHVEFLTPEGTVLAAGQFPPSAPGAVRLLLIYAFPKKTSTFHLYYWGKPLTLDPVGIGQSGMALPYPASE
jgi:hypothetical protein